MKIGMFQTPFLRPERKAKQVFQWAVQQAIHADRIGFSEYWVGEHGTLDWESIPSPELVIAAAAFQTEQIKFGPLAHLLPYHHPATLAVQTDPLPVVLRITGPARSVYDKGRLLTTNIAGCLVNGAARGDLSSEKVYVKLQRMTCPQPNGRFAVSDVKGFIAFGGKTGVRGRVVSREGALVGQAFLAGLAGGFGRGFSANTNTAINGTNVTVGGQRQKLSPGDILAGGLGEGVATSGDMVSKYLIERAEQYQPVIEMPTGIDVEIVFLEGVFING